MKVASALKVQSLERQRRAAQEVKDKRQKAVEEEERKARAEAVGKATKEAAKRKEVNISGS